MNIVFATGTPKSGTTFLQMIFNSHPEVSCPSEHHFDFFIDAIPKLLKEYNDILKLADEITTKQGPIYFEEEDFQKILKYIIEIAAYKGAKGKKVKWYGINDNRVTMNNRFEFYNNLFKNNIRFIVIVRDPRSVTVSSWYFKLRHEGDKFLIVVKNKENWANCASDIWNRENKNMLNFYKKYPEKVLIVKYEDLVLNPFPNYKKIFEFLEVDTNEKLIENIIEKTSFKRFKDGKFFRKGSIDEWKRELPPAGIKITKRKCRDLMKYFGYPFLYLKES